MNSSLPALQKINKYGVRGGLLLIALIYGVILLRFYHSVDIAHWGDTNTYTEISRSSWDSAGLWAARYPFTTPILYKACGENENCIAIWQIWLALVGWLSLGLVVTRFIETPGLKLLSFATILNFSLAPNIICWNKILLSEPLSNSLYIWMLASWLLCADVLRRHPNLAALKQIGLVAALFPAMILFSFTRDPNSYMLLGFGLLSLIATLIWRKRLRPFLPALSTFVLGITLLFIAQSYTISYSKRTLTTFPQNIIVRILPDENKRAYFEAHGMPVNADIMAMSGQRTHLDQWPTEFTEWVYGDGQRTYALYLLSHPQISLLEPLQNWHDMVVNNVYPYAKTYELPPRLQSNIALWFYDFSGLWLISIVFIILFLFSVLLIKRQGRWFWFFPLVLLALVYPLLFLVWHGGESEPARHSVGLNIQLRLAIWLLLFFLLDGLWVWMRKESHAADVRLQPRHVQTVLLSVLIPLLLAEGILRLPATQHHIALPAATALLPDQNALHVWGVSDLEYQLYQDKLSEVISDNNLVIAPYTDPEGQLTVIDIKDWTFTPLRGVENYTLSELLRQWQASALPRYLVGSQIGYIYAQQDLIQQQPAIVQSNLNNSNYYELLKSWDEGARGLYRVQAPSEWGKVTQTSTLGLLEADYADFLTYRETFDLVPKTSLILNPSTGVDWFENAAEIGHLVEQLGLVGEARYPLFDLMLIWEQQQHITDLTLDAEQTAALERWRETKYSSELASMGIDYLLVNDTWMRYLSQDNGFVFLQSSHYVLVREWNEADGIPGFYRLYKVVTPQ